MSTDRARVSAGHWLGLLFFLNSVLLCLGAWTAVPGNDAVQMNPLAGPRCEMVLSRLHSPCLDIPAGLSPAMAQWARAVPVESESPDKVYALRKIANMYNYCPWGTDCPGDVSCPSKRISRRLYLQKKALLC
jgi:hypothetical protein